VVLILSACSAEQLEELSKGSDSKVSYRCAKDEAGFATATGSVSINVDGKSRGKASLDSTKKLKPGALVESPSQSAACGVWGGKSLKLKAIFSDKNGAALALSADRLANHGKSVISDPIKGVYGKLLVEGHLRKLKIDRAHIRVKESRGSMSLRFKLRGEVVGLESKTRTQKVRGKCRTLTGKKKRNCEKERAVNAEFKLDGSLRLKLPKKKPAAQ